MAINTNLQEDIKVLRMAGFTKDEIIKNLTEKGFSLDDIQENMTADNTTSSAYEMPEEGKTSVWSILLGVFFVLVMIMRLARAGSNGGNGFMLIGVLTAGFMAYYFFTKKS